MLCLPDTLGFSICPCRRNLNLVQAVVRQANKRRLEPAGSKRLGIQL